MSLGEIPGDPVQREERLSPLQLRMQALQQAHLDELARKGHYVETAPRPIDYSLVTDVLTDEELPRMPARTVLPRPPESTPSPINRAHAITNWAQGKDILRKLIDKIPILPY